MELQLFVDLKGWESPKDSPIHYTRREVVSVKTVIGKKITVNLLELAMQAIIICIAVYSVGVSSRWWWAQGMRPFDFTVYYYAGLGVAIEGWFYDNLFMSMFSVLHLWDLSTSYLYFSGLSTLLFMIVAHKILALRFGWFFVLINLYTFSSVIIHGNIQSLVILLSFYPLGSLFCAAMKPFYIIIPLLFTFTIPNNKIKALWLIAIAFVGIYFYPSQTIIDKALKNNDLVVRCLLLSMSVYYVIAQIEMKDVKAMLKIKRVAI